MLHYRWSIYSIAEAAVALQVQLARLPSVSAAIICRELS